MFAKIKIKWPTIGSLNCVYYASVHDPLRGLLYSLLLFFIIIVFAVR